MSSGVLYFMRACFVGAATGVLVPEQPRAAIGTVLLIIGLEIGDAARSKRKAEAR